MTPLFDNICNLPLPTDLFAQTIHPRLPILSVCLASGHVQTYRLPPTGENGADIDLNDNNNNDDDDDDDDSNDNTRMEPRSKRVRISDVIHSRSIDSIDAGRRKNGGKIKPGRSSSTTTTTSNGILRSKNQEHVLPHSILSQPGQRRSSAASENGLGSIESIWSTRRHKGSCRTLAFNHDGSICYSAGTDGLVKCFDSETGRVSSKIALPELEGRSKSVIDAPTLVHALSPQGLLLATDSGALFYHDLREGGREIVRNAAQTWRPHGEEHVNSLVPLPASDASTSGFPKSWVSVGGTTLAVTDMRKGVVGASEDQEVELTSVCFVGGLKKGGTSVGEKVCVGQADGVLSLWERGIWGDLDDRIIVGQMEAGIDAVVEVPTTEFGYGRGKLKMNEKVVACGLEDGRVRFVRIGRNGVLTDWDIKHDDIDGVVGLDFDISGRLVTGGGMTVKVWTEAKGMPGGGRNLKAKSGIDDDDSEDEDEDENNNHNDEDSDNDDDANSSDEEERSKTRKKRKRNKGKDKSGGKAINFSM